MHKYPKSFTSIPPDYVGSELVVKSTAELEEQIKKELAVEHMFGSETLASGVPLIKPPK